MRRNRSLGTLSVAVLVVSILALVFAPVVWAASKYKSLYTFKSGADGANPISSLLLDQAGNLYGTTIGGGAHGDYGTAFELAPNGDGSWTKRVLHSFNNDGKDGFQPSGLILHSTGNLYGTTAWGGDHNLGTVFKLTPNGDGSWTESILHSFNNDGMDGNGPDSYGRLTFDKQGNLYGTTFYGGVNVAGTVFKMMPNLDGSWTESVLHSFSGPDGSHPWGGVIIDSGGNLFGTTYDGGPSNTGTVFQLISNGNGTWTEDVIYSFKLNGKDGVGPIGGVIFDSAGNLYGTTTLGNATYNHGTVFTLKPGAHGHWKETLLHIFRGHPGEFPTASLVFDRHGILYGTTEGSQSPHGSAFEIAP